jgi:hypothetical protein
MITWLLDLLLALKQAMNILINISGTSYDLHTHYFLSLPAHNGEARCCKLVKRRRSPSRDGRITPYIDTIFKSTQSSFQLAIISSAFAHCLLLNSRHASYSFCNNLIDADIVTNYSCTSQRKVGNQTHTHARTHTQCITCWLSAEKQMPVLNTMCALGNARMGAMLVVSSTC